MIKDGQVRKLRSLLDAGSTLSAAARRTGMDEKSARKYRDSETFPSEQLRQRTYRTRKDPFENVWLEVQARLEAEPTLRHLRCSVGFRIRASFPIRSGERSSDASELGVHKAAPSRK